MDSKQTTSSKLEKVLVENLSLPAPLTGNDAVSRGLENTLILDLILKLVIGHERKLERPSRAQQIHQVQSLRQVSKLWNERTTKHFSKIRKPTIFGNHGPICEYVSGDDKLRRFLNTMQNAVVVPMQRFVFLPSIFTPTNQPLMLNFMHNIAPLFATEIWFCLEIHENFKLSTPVFRGFNPLKNLKTIHFDVQHIKKKPINNARHVPNFIQEILLAADGAVETIDLDLMDHVQSPWHLRQSNRLIWTFFRHIPTSVKTLSLTGVNFQQQHVVMMERNNVQLRKLQLDYHVALNQQEMDTFLRHQSSSLTSFKFVTDCWATKAFSLDMPKMDNLLHLELEGTIALPFAISEKFPKLKTLHMLEWRDPTTYFSIFSPPSPSTTTTRTKTTTFGVLDEIYFSIFFPQAEFVIMAAKIFPNISKIHVPYKPGIIEALKAVYEHFPNITELYISDQPQAFEELEPYVNLDCVFSGVSEKTYKRLCRIEHQWDDIGIANMGQQENNASLLQLTRLRKLVIDIKFHELRLATILTNFSAHFVFLKMENLQVLKTTDNLFQISRRYHDLLGGKLHVQLLED